MNRRVALTLAAFGILWLLLCLTLDAHWSANPQYAFGRIVPPLALYLLARRWSARPPPSQPIGTLASAGAAILALSLLPTWLIVQPAPDWRLVDWIFAAQAVSLSLLAWGRAGGRAWMRHFAFPTAFIFTAIPWPAGLESALIQWLTQLVTAVTVAALGLVGIPALQHGNLIEIGSGLLGVDEACSGVRSFQAALMAALFLGEMERFNPLRRTLLLAIGVSIAILTNIGRASLLAWTAHHHSPDAVARWHDPAGFGVLTVCLIGIWAAAVWLARDRPPPPTHAAPGPAHPLPTGPLLAFTLWLLALVAGTELWFRSAPQAAAQKWTFSLPAGRPSFKPEPIDRATQEMLRYQEGRSASWDDDAGGKWLAYHFQWPEGRGRSRILARMHRPEICLPAAGWQLAEEHEPVTLPAGPVALTFRALRFTQGHRTAHVWFCSHEDRPPGTPQPARQSHDLRAASLEAVVRRERTLGQQILEIVLLSRIDSPAADELFRREIAPLLHPALPK